ncbi:hypothetical protein UCD39_16485 [Nitrospirillum sp. BR 11752]|uniref:Tetratricopeptide repeat protein n=1 Tax=Nitrospirillum amazonense TaxID=28077 RepID=A0A560GN76_9PROT|nr:hypothetical protein [Nitrospirillum amazonense]MEE3625564.1 hypothetical protein [Nitrospirillum sp. BR 11752]TWB35221.1 hypothetical protein FBZ90_12020 [Nitrospirillum amazonense]
MSVVERVAVGSSAFRGRLPGLSVLAAPLLALTLALAPAAPAAAQPIPGLAGNQTLPDAQAMANRQFVQAMEAIRKADQSYDLQEQTRLLLQADKLLSNILVQSPESPLAVQLSTNQFVGDFDYNDFKSRIRSLACNDAQSTGCFLYRIEGLIQPVDYPITAPRWDWLSLAVAHYHLGDKDRTKQIIAPFIAAFRRAPPVTDTGRDLFLGRALSLTGEVDMALDITRRINDCSTRIYNLTDISQALIWKGDKTQANKLVEEAADYAQANNCAWELGLVAEGFYKAGNVARAHTMFLNTVEEQFSRFKDRKGNCCAPELAVAAGDLGDPNLALGLLRTVQQESPWTIPAVLGRLGARGEMQLATTYAEQVQDTDIKAETFVQLMADALKTGDRKQAEALSGRIDKLLSTGTDPKPLILAQRARADKLLFKDQRWRTTYLAGLSAAERSNSGDTQRKDLAVPMLAALVEIETGTPMLQ